MPWGCFLSLLVRCAGSADAEHLHGEGRLAAAVQVHRGLQTRGDEAAAGLRAHLDLRADGNVDRRREAEVAVDRDGEADLVGGLVVAAAHAHGELQCVYAFEVHAGRGGSQVLRRGSEAGQRVVGNVGFILRAVVVLGIAIAVGHDFSSLDSLLLKSAGAMQLVCFRP